MLFRSLLNCSSKTLGLPTAHSGPVVIFSPPGSKKVVQGRNQKWQNQGDLSTCREGELRQAMTPSGTLVLRLAGAVRQGENPIEESTMPNRHEKNIEKVFPVFGHRFVAKVVQQCSSKMNLALCCRPSTSLSTVQWTEISSGVSASRQFTVSQSIRMTISCTQGLSCEQCGMTLHKWCYTKIVTPCPGST